MRLGPARSPWGSALQPWDLAHPNLPIQPQITAQIKSVKPCMALHFDQEHGLTTPLNAEASELMPWPLRRAAQAHMCLPLPWAAACLDGAFRDTATGEHPEW